MTARSIHASKLSTAKPFRRQPGPGSVRAKAEQKLILLGVSHHISQRPSHTQIADTLRLIRKNKAIALPRLAAETRLSSRDLDRILKDLSREGLVLLQQDPRGVTHVRPR